MWGIGYTSKIEATGLSELSFGLQSAAGSAISSVMPSYNQQIGNSNFSVSLSPNIMFGTHTNLGVNFGLNYADENVNFGVGMSTNYTSNGWGFKDNGFNVGKYWYSSVNFGDGYSASFGQTYFGGTDKQATGRFGLRHKEWSVYYENDMHGDGHDRCRTAAASINYNGKYGNHGIGVNIYTEQAGYYAGNEKRRWV